MAHPPQDETVTEFRGVVNMTPARLRAWLASDASASVGMTRDGKRVTTPQQAKSVGHHMGERILAIHATQSSDISEADLADMRKVVGYVHRHLAQRPQGDVTDSRWRHSLMNWGHDPAA